jgi:hypothetical protein
MYLVTDENRLAVGTSTSASEDMAKKSELPGSTPTFSGLTSTGGATITKGATDVNQLGAVTILNPSGTSDARYTSLILGKAAATAQAATFGYKYHSTAASAYAYVASYGDAEDTQSLRVYTGGSVVVGNPTGGNKDIQGAINASAVYDDNVLLTCMAAAKEFIETGTVDLEAWDSRVPDIVVPERVELVPVMDDFEVEGVELQPITTGKNKGAFRARQVAVKERRQRVRKVAVFDQKGRQIDEIDELVVEKVVVPAHRVKRSHRTARIFKAMLDGGFDPRDPLQYFAKWKAEEAVPGMPTKADWVQGEVSSGEMINRLWLTSEMTTIILHALWLRLGGHEQRIADLEAVSSASPGRQ